MINVTHEIKNKEIITKFFKTAPNDFPFLLEEAINRSGRILKKISASRFSKTWGVPKHELRDLKYKKAVFSRGEGEGILILKGSRIGVGYLNPSESSSGVSFKYAGENRFKEKAFMSYLGGKYVGVGGEMGVFSLLRKSNINNYTPFHKFRGLTHASELPDLRNTRNPRMRTGDYFVTKDNKPFLMKETVGAYSKEVKNIKHNWYQETEEETYELINNNFLELVDAWLLVVGAK